MIAATPEALRDAIENHPLDEVTVDEATLDAARRTVDATGVLLVGEPHGVRETPGVLFSLAVAVGAAVVGFEWSHEELDPTLRVLVDEGSVDLDALWALPASAEAFCGDGRVTAGHFALLLALRERGALREAIAFDRLDPDPVPPWHVRERDMAERLLAKWDGLSRLLVLTGATHARLDADAGETMATHLAERLPGLSAAMIDYESGTGWSREPYDVSGRMPTAAITIAMPVATPAVVPGRLG